MAATVAVTVARVKKEECFRSASSKKACTVCGESFAQRGEKRVLLSFSSSGHSPSVNLVYLQYRGISSRCGRAVIRSRYSSTTLYIDKYLARSRAHVSWSFGFSSGRNFFDALSPARAAPFELLMPAPPLALPPAGKPVSQPPFTF